MAVVSGQGKTVFTKEVLEKNNQANVKDVNEAWKAAGHDGSISDSLVKNVRSELKLTGNVRPGRRPAGASGATPKTATASKSKGGAVAKLAVGHPPGKTNGKPATKAILPGAKPRKARADRVLIFQEMEEELDGLIFKSLAAGGFPEFEETLRKARRILARSHRE